MFTPNNKSNCKGLLNLLSLSILTLFFINIQGPVALSQSIISGEESLKKDNTIPIDTNCLYGKLHNGVSYYIRENKKPEKRASFELVVNVGSVVEEENERGYAHFIEHMAFNGTKNYRKEDIIDYFEKLGMRFGPEVNASTGFDETVYKLEVPTNNKEAVQNAIGILSDWAYQIRFDPEEIKKERKIILAELRERSGASKRVMEKHFPILFKGSKYGENLPIGKKEIIEKATQNSLRLFYRKWYQPDRMAVIAVGDFSAGGYNKTKILELINKYFSKIPSTESEKKEAHFPLPVHKNTLYSIASDKELTKTRISIIEKKRPQKLETVGDYKELLIQYLIEGMINKRLKEITRKENPPFINAGVARYRIIRTSDVLLLTAVTDETKLLLSYKTLLTMIKRFKQFGFTEEELNLEKREILRMYEKAYEERETRESQSYVSEYEEHFLNGYAIPGIEYEYTLVNKLLPNITMTDVDKYLKEWFNGENRVILISLPKKEGMTIPEEAQLKKIEKEVENLKIKPYTAEKIKKISVPEISVTGKIKESHSYGELGITEWILSNGSRVYLKPTQFKKGEVLFQAISPGGLSLVDDDKYISARLSPSLISESGIDNIAQSQLEKILVDKIVNIEPWLSEAYEGFEGSFDFKDAESFMKLLYLYFIEPRKDETAFKTFREKLKVKLKNRASDPELLFWDKLRTLVTNNHPRGKPISFEDLKKLDLNTAFEVYKQRFRNANDFTFIFVGDFNIQQMKSLILKYIGSLPSEEKTEEWLDKDIDPPKSTRKERIYIGLENKSDVCIVFAGEFEWSFKKDFLIKVLAEYLDISIRERIREKEGGAYNTWTWGYTQKYPDNEYYLYIFFDADPTRINELERACFEEFKSIKKGLIDKEIVKKVREIMIKDYEESLKENNFWITSIGTTLRRKEPLRVILQREELINSINSEMIEDGAKLFLDENKYIELILLPEKNQ